MIYGSVCSGIEAATQAWHSLGWTPAFFSEIDKFPSAVLAHHYGSNMPGEPLTSNGVPNLGDMTKFQEWPDYAIDLLGGGTPCQSFSIAGLRKGLDDPRGNLMLTFGAVAKRYRPDWIVWENVPGVLSSNGGRDFGTFLGMLGQLGYGFAYRILDTEYCRTHNFPRAIPQRRRRVFVVGNLTDWRRAAAVLFDAESLQGNPAPRRETGQSVAGTIASRPTGGGGLGTDFELDGGLVAKTLLAKGNDSFAADLETYVSVANSGDVSHTICASTQQSLDAEAETILAIQERAISENPDAGPDGVGVKADGASYTIEARQTPQAVAFKPSHFTRGKDGAPSDVFPPLSADADSGDQEAVVAFDTTQITSKQNGNNPQPGDPCHTLASGAHAPAIAFSSKDYGNDAQEGVSPTLRSGNHAGSHQNGGVMPAVAFDAQNGKSHPWAVRRLMPVETERLQGFPDKFTKIPWRGKPADQCPDGPRYKTHGNSMSVNVMEWIGERIEFVSETMTRVKI